MENVVNMLQHFGLNDKEANTYLANLELGPTSIQKLAKCARLNRSTVHFIADRLKKKGLMGETRKGKKRLLFAENPQKFKELLLREKSSIKTKEDTLVDLMPILEQIESTDDKKPQIHFYEGMQGFYDICLKSIEKAQDEILFLSSYDDFINIDHHSEFDAKVYIPSRIKKGITIRMLVFKNEWAEVLRSKEDKEMRKLRYLPKNFKFKSTIFIYGDEFSMVSSKAPYLGVVINSKELAHTMKQIYEMLWTVGK